MACYLYPNEDEAQVRVGFQRGDEVFRKSAAAVIETGAVDLQQLEELAQAELEKLLLPQIGSTAQW